MAEVQNNQLFYPKSVSFDEEKFTLLLHIDDAAVNFDNISDIAAQNGFDKKNKFHITVIGFKNGAAIQRVLDELPRDEKQKILQHIRSLVARADWGFTFLPERYHIAKNYSFRSGATMATEHRESYIQLVSMPDMITFYDALNSALGIRLEPPPPHVTLYTKGNTMGIGINSQEEFLKLNPKLIS